MLFKSKNKKRNVIHMAETIKKECNTYNASLSANCLPRISDITEKENLQPNHKK